MRQHRPIKSFVERVFSWQSERGIKLLTVLCLLGLLTGCFNRSQTAANAPTSPTPIPTASTGSPLPSPSSSAIGSPPASPQPTPSPTISKQSAVSKDIENRLSKSISAATGLPVQSVTCPPEPETKAGSRFDCSGVSAGQTFAINIAITNANGPQFQWSTKGLLVLSKLEQFIQQQLKDRNGITVTADCGGGVRIAKPGDTFECQVTDPQGQSRTTKITVKDEQGTVDVALI